MQALELMSHPAERVVLVVMEYGSGWPTHLTGGLAGCVALRQEPHEGHVELLQRIHGRVRAVERFGGCVECAVLSCSDDVSDRTLGSRLPLARALLAVVRPSAGRLELAARWSGPHRAKQAVVALAGALSEAPAGTFGSVSVRFLNRVDSVPAASSPLTLRRDSGASRGSRASATRRSPA
jgi:hypothetical protein